MLGKASRPGQNTRRRIRPVRLRRSASRLTVVRTILTLDRPSDKNAPRALSAIAFTLVTKVILLTGCTNSFTEIQQTEAKQRANIRLQSSDELIAVDDVNGDTMHMRDGVQIVMDNLTFEREVQPLFNLSSQKPWGQ